MVENLYLILALGNTTSNESLKKMNNPQEQVKLSYDTESNEISIIGISQESIVIKSDVDIDLTSLVVGLSKRIDSAVPVHLDLPQIGDNEKLSIIVKTISEIIDEYNACLKSEKEEEEDLPEFDDEDVPF